MRFSYPGAHFFRGASWARPAAPRHVNAPPSHVKASVFGAGAYLSGAARQPRQLNASRMRETHLLRMGSYVICYFALPIPSKRFPRLRKCIYQLYKRLVMFFDLPAPLNAHPRYRKRIY